MLLYQRILYDDHYDLFIRLGDVGLVRCSNAVQVNAHTGDLRHHVVAGEGRKELVDGGWEMVGSPSFDGVSMSLEVSKFVHGSRTADLDRC